MNKRTMDEMIAYFNQEVSKMDISQENKMKLLGMITAIGYESKKQEVVRGKWRFEKGDGKTCVDGWVCTNCNCGFHTNVPYFEEFNFCPNCGAKMDGKEKEDG